MQTTFLHKTSKLRPGHYSDCVFQLHTDKTDMSYIFDIANSHGHLPAILQLSGLHAEGGENSTGGVNFTISPMHTQ